MRRKCNGSANRRDLIEGDGKESQRGCEETALALLRSKPEDSTIHRPEPITSNTSLSHIPGGLSSLLRFEGRMVGPVLREVQKCPVRVAKALLEWS